MIRCPVDNDVNIIEETTCIFISFQLGCNTKMNFGKSCTFTSHASKNMSEIKQIYPFQSDRVSIVSYITPLHPSCDAALQTEKKLIAENIDINTLNSSALFSNQN